MRRCMVNSSSGKAQAPGYFPSVSRYCFEFQAIDPVCLPPYSGSAWRGLLGHGLRRTVCVTRQKTCTGCLLEGSCIYSSFYESPALGAGITGRGDAVPHPFVLSVSHDGPQKITPGERLRLGITLIGPTTGVLPYLIHALQTSGQRGIGKGHGRFRLMEVKAEPDLGSRQWEQIYSAETGQLYELPEVSCSLGDPPGRIGMSFSTPLRIKQYGKLVGPKEFTVSHLIRQAHRRCGLLARLYVGDDSLAKLRDIEQAEADIRATQVQLHWRDWTRYSSRQGKSMQMGGLIGDLVLEGEGLSAVWPCLWLGQWVHLGKATSMGLGRYRLVDAASLSIRTKG